MKKINLIFFSLVFSVSLFGRNIPDNMLPEYEDTTCQIICHEGFTLQYSTRWMNPVWVAYNLLPEELNGIVPRYSRFHCDTMVNGGSASYIDYAKTGYDIGHLCPADNMKYSKEAQYDCFYMSNMVPQKPGFNRGIWKALESKVSKWAKENDSMYIYTGPIIIDTIFTIGIKHKVIIPSSCFKVIVAFKGKETNGIGFIMENEPSKKPLMSYDYMVVIDSVEKITKLKFPLPAEVKNKIEGEKWGLIVGGSND
jgi:endonuclease G